MKSNYALPITIIIAGALIAGAIYFSNTKQVAQNDGTPQKTSIRPYDPTVDHILGNPNASVKVIEYADLECPYCSVFEKTMHQIMDYYGTSGNVAWVYRPLPLTQIHSKAPKEAEAAECAAEQGGDVAFYKYIDGVYAVTPGENNLDLAQLPLIAGKIGLDVTAFNQCLASGKYAAKVQKSVDEAMKAGAQGTPFTLITIGGEAVTLSGAQPYDSMRAAIDTVLQYAPGATSTPTSMQ